MELVDVADSKSADGDIVWVRVPPPAPRRSKVRFAPTFFYFCRIKERHPPAPLLLLSESNPHQKLISRSFCCSSLPNRIRCAGFRFGLGHEISGLKPPDTSEQALYRLLRFFSQSEGTQIFFGHVHPTCPDGAIATREETAMVRRGIYVPGKNGIRACASCLCGCLPGGFVKKL